MPNFFTDNEDILDFLSNTDLRDLAALKERGEPEMGYLRLRPDWMQRILSEDGS